MSGPVVDLMRPAPGVVRCCICFQAWPVERLWIDPDGQRWDVCVPCAMSERPTQETWPCHDHDLSVWENPLGYVLDPGERAV